MLRSICLQDLDFREIPLTCRSMRGVPYQQWVRVGMPKIPENVIRSVFYLYASREDALAGKSPGGTGFVIEICDNPQLPRHYYGVTNYHIVCDNEDIYPVVRLNTIDGGIDVLDFNPDQWEWLQGKYDIAVIPLSLSDEIHAAHSISTNLFVQHQQQYYVGDDVFMIGLFVDHAGISEPMHLTNNEPIRSDVLAASGHPDAAGAPANEIEITPEMIEVGAEFLFRDPFLNMSPSLAELLSEEVLKRALKCRANMCSLTNEASPSL